MSPLATLAMICGLFSPVVKAQSITPANDGTGTVITTEGNKIDISGGSLSSDRTNLFHSFSKFGLDANQTANFLSQPSIQNILGRVTGNNASLINGLIQVTGGNSNLYLINPAGIIFGSSASLNVPAAFTATTANGVGFGNNQWFNAIGSNNYANLIGNPTEFAFTTSLGGSIFNAGNLAVGEGQSLMLLGGMVLNTGTLAAPDGNITIMAVPAEKVVRVTPTNSLLSLDLPVETKTKINPQPFSPLSLPALLTGGNVKKVTGVTVENGVVKLTSTNTAIPTDVGTSIVSGQVSVSNSQESINKVSNATAQINILGDRVALLNANINASGSNGGTVLVGGDYQGKGTVPNATHTFVSSDTAIAADALQSGNGGKVIVWADDTTRFFGSISARGGAIAGNGGLVETSGKNSLNVTGSKVDASAAKGQAGTWLLDPTDINIATGGSGTIVGGLFDPSNNSDIDPATIETALDSGTDVTLTTSSGTGGNGDITLTNDINQAGNGTASLTLTSRQFLNPGGSTINLSSTGNLTFNLNQVNPETNAPTSSIQNAIDAIGAVSGNSIINLGAGTYTGNTVNIIEKTLTLNGNGASSTILNGQNNYHVLDISSEGTVTINNLAIINGKGVGNDGGGIAYFGSGTLNVNNITFTGNSTEFNIESGGRGGGIYSEFGTLNVNNSTFSTNSATNGGGIYSSFGTTNVSNSSFIGNSASNGGGIYNDGSEGSTLNVNNSTFGSNSASNNGGGIFNSLSSQANINSTTFSGNSATDGGGIFNESGALTALKNTIVAGNTSSQNPDVSGSLIASSSYNLISDGTGTVGISNGINGNQVGTAATPIDAQLSVLGNYGGSTQTFALLPASPAINAGISDENITTDQRGISRPQNTTPDIGAFELVGYTLTPTAGSGQSAIVNNTFSTPLQATVTENGFNQPIPGIIVIFNAPTFGATANFTGSTVLTTNSSGNVTIPITANTVAGSYSIRASSGTLTPANFSLINNPDVAAAIIATGGTPQSTVVNTAFNNPLIAKVQDQYGNAIANATVTFNAPKTSATANFTGNTTLTTDTSGNVSIPVTANTIAGSYTVTANNGSLTPANFSLTNNPDVAAAIIATGGTPQSTIVNTAFNNPLIAKVQDQYGNAIANATVTFNAPITGATSSFTGNTSLTTNSSGNVSIPITANIIAGNYSITANSGTLTPANFSLTNNPDVAAAIIATGGTPQSTIVNTAFNNPLIAKVQDQYGNAIANATVTFNAPKTSATANFTGNTTLTTDTSGNVSIPVTANTIAGSYTVTANNGSLTPANFSLTNNPDVAAAIIATGGTPQSTIVNTAFNNPLIAKVQDQYGNAIANATVTFNAPITGATSSFTGNTSLTTDTTGNVSIPVTANTVAGNYSITANSGTLTPANFSLTNNPDVAAAIIATGGTPQSTIVNTAFNNPLIAKVQDQYGNAIANATVTFNAPITGATSSFTGNTSLTTDTSGNVSIPITANTVAGNYSITANSGTLTPANFSLTNNPDVAAAIIATGGTPQSTIVNTAFNNSLIAKVQDQYGNAIANATVTFNAPTSGATTNFTGNTTLTTNSSGNVAIPVTANTVAGNYSITANSGTLTPANFSLTNNPDVAAAIIATGGTPQNTIVNTAFTNPLQAKVQDQYGNAIANATVTFNAPKTSASANFTGSTTLSTDTSGNVSIPVTANTIAGNYGITANSGTLTPANFSLINNPDVAAAIIATGGTPQSTIVNTAFNNPLIAKVQDQYGNAIANATVTFNAPITGATGSFTGNTSLTSNSSGNVSIPITANTVAGNYSITANSGTLTPANFSLINNPDVAAAIIATGGTPQSTIVNTAFNNPLIAKVQDQYGNAIANATVTFNAPITGATSSFTGNTSLTTDTSGNVSIPVTANTIAGSYTVTANNGSLTPANFSLTNNPDPTNPITPTNIVPEVPTTPTVPINTPNPETLKKLPTTQIPVTTNPTTEVVLDTAVGNIEQEYTTQFQEYLGDAAKPNLEAPNTARNILQQISDATGIQPALIYVNFIPTSLSPSNTLKQQKPKILASSNDRLELVIVTAKGLPIRKVLPVTRSQVIATAQTFTKYVTKSSQNHNYIDPAKKLYQWLITPVEPELQAQKINNLAFIMDEGLRSLPVAALYDGQKYLVESYSVGLMPSLSLTDTKYVDIRKAEVLGMGASEFRNQNPLPAVPTELMTITSRLWQGNFFLNENFTLANLQKQRQQKSFGIIHLATHAEFEPGDRSNSYIQMWDTQLKMDQLRQLGWSNPPVQLVVLSSCRTAVGDKEAELGFAGFAVQAGVKSALASLWYVSDEGTLGLMTEFYEQLKKAPIKAEALRQAQIAMLKGQVRLQDGKLKTSNFDVTLPPTLAELGNKDLRHPYFWSAFTLIGNPW